MKKFLLSSFVLLTSYFVLAHPGIGIVIDSKGNIYYTDLKQVWKIDKTGKKTVVVRDVHTHELYMDANDNLFGEHLWYNGEKLNTWGHYIWSLKNDGTLVNIKERTEGFLQEYSFMRDSSGNMYWVERFTVSKFKKKTPDGTISTIGEGKYRDIRWSHCTVDGIIFFLDLDKLYKLTPQGKFTLLAEKLDDKTPAFLWVGEKHNAYGIWTDKQDNIYVALHGGQKVKRITPDGKSETVIYSTTPWSPTSGVFDKEGNCWLLEYTMTGDCRVRKISKQELSAHAGSTKAVLANYILPIGIAVAVLGLLSVFIAKKIRKPVVRFVVAPFHV